MKWEFSKEDDRINFFYPHRKTQQSLEIITFILNTLLW